MTESINATVKKSRDITLRILLFLWIVASCGSPVTVHGQTSSTASQSVVADYANNGLNGPTAVAVGRSGSVFIADTGNNRVLEIPWEVESKKYGAQRVLIDGLFNPTGIAVAANEDLFIADSGNNRIVELPFNRVNQTYGEAVALGGGLLTPQALAAGPGGDLYVADTGNNRVLMLPWDSKTGAFGTAEILGTNFFTPEGIAMGPGGKLFIANFGNSTVVELQVKCQAANECGEQTVVADSSSNSLINPAGLAVSAGGSLLIAQPNSNKVVQLTWNRTTGALSSQVTLGTELNSPSGVAVDTAGNVYVADTLNNRILKIVQQQTSSQTNSGLAPSRNKRH